MAISVRPALEADIDRLVDIENAVFAGDRLSRRSLRRLVASPSAVIILAEIDGNTIGYAVVLLRRGTLAARLYSIAVAPELAGRRVGAGLLEAAENVARSQGRALMRLEVRTDNGPAIGLYQGAGYRIFGRKPGYDQDGEDALRMEKMLAEAVR